MDYKDLTLPVKQMLGYLIGIFLLTILFSLSIAHFSTLASDYNSSMGAAWRQLNALQDMRTYLLQAKLDVRQPARVRSSLELISASMNSMMRSSNLGLPRDLLQVVREMLAFRAQALVMADLTESGAEPERLAAQQVILDRYYHLFMGRLYVEIERSKAATAIAETSYLRRISYLLLLNTILAPLSFAFLYIYGYFLSNYLGLRLRNFLDEFKLILSGDRAARITDDSEDEIGQIARGINQLAERLPVDSPPRVG